MNDSLDNLANSISRDMVENENFNVVKAFDLATIMVIVQIIVLVIGLFKKRGSGSSSDIKEMAKNTNFIQRVIMKIRLNRYMKDDSSHYDIYDKHKDQMLRSVLRKVGDLETSKLNAVLMEIPDVQDRYIN